MQGFYVVKSLFVFLISFVCLHSLCIQAHSFSGGENQPAAGVSAQQAAGGTAAQAVSKDNGAGEKGKSAQRSDAPSDDGYGLTESALSKDAKPLHDPRPLEDWDTLAIPKDLPVADPVIHLRGDFPEFTRELVRLSWRSGDDIDVYVMKPVGVEKPPVVLYLYSYPSDTDRFINNDFAKAATKNGFAAVGFVSALTGQRYHDIAQKKWFVSELRQSMMMTVHDVQFILNYLAKRGDLDMTHVGMYGDGSGASVAIMAAEVDPRIKVLDLFNAWGDWPDWFAKSTVVPDDERPDYLKPEFLKKVENVDPLKWLPQLKTQTVRLQYILSDTLTPVAARERMDDSAPPNVQHVHYKNIKAFVADAAAEEGVFQWVKEQLGPKGDQNAIHDAKVPSPAVGTADR